MKLIITRHPALSALLAAAGAVLLAGSASAQRYDSRYDPYFDRWSSAGRAGTGAVGYGVGLRMCGPRCARGMERATNRVYDGSRHFAREGGARLQEYGRRARERGRRR